MKIMKNLAETVPKDYVGSISQNCVCKNDFLNIKDTCKLAQILHYYSKKITTTTTSFSTKVN